MGRPLKKWPTYALDSLERTLYELQEIERAARLVQLAIAEGDADSALILLSDVRVASRRCVEHLVRARTGEYDKSETTRDLETATSWHTATSAAQEHDFRLKIGRG